MSERDSGQDDLPQLVVVFQDDSPELMQLAAAARGLCRVIWLIDPDSKMGELVPLMKRLGTVVPVLGEPVEVAAAALAPLQPQGMVTFADTAMDHVAAIAAGAGIRFNEPRTALSLADKLAQRQALRDGGIWTPPVVAIPAGADRESLARIAAAASYPAVLKPRRSSGSRHAFKVPGARELLARLDELAGEPPEELLLEGYMSDGPAPGGFAADYVSVESVTFDGSIRHLATNGRLPLTFPLSETGVFIPSLLAGEELTAVLDLATRALQAIGLRWGFSHIEIKLTANGPQVIEINGRIGGGVGEMMRLTTGLELVPAAMRVALGIEPGLPTLPPTHGVAYHQWLQPPAGARRVLSISGVETLGARPGVKQVKVMRRAGAALDPRGGTRNEVLDITGLASDHQGMLEINEQLYRDVQVEYEYATADDGGERR